jgi:hypothetical protein
VTRAGRASASPGPFRIGPFFARFITQVMRFAPDGVEY